MANRIDIMLGKINISERQFERAGILVKGKVLQIGMKGGELYCIATDPLTPGEKNDLINSLKSLSDDPLPREIEAQEMNANPFLKIAPKDIDAWVESNIKNIDDAKLAIKNIVKLITFIKSRMTI